MSDQPVIANRYQSDHLFLLVGTNPLPNFVAATLLLKPGGQLYLVHSQATQPVAERLARYWSEKEKRAQPQYVCVDEADGADVRRNIERVLRGIQNGNVGLNYTGGTKTMSVHACRTLLSYQESHRRDVTLSYLDARSNEMYIEHGSDQPFASESVLYEVQPSLRDIVELHAFRLVAPIDTQAMLPHLAAVLAQAHQSQEASKAWRTWCDNVLRKLSMADNPENIERQIGRSWDAEGKVRVFGRNHLDNLSHHLREWFISVGSQ